MSCIAKSVFDCYAAGWSAEGTWRTLSSTGALVHHLDMVARATPGIFLTYLTCQRSFRPPLEMTWRTMLPKLLRANGGGLNHLVPFVQRSTPVTLRGLPLSRMRVFTMRCQFLTGRSAGNTRLLTGK